MIVCLDAARRRRRRINQAGWLMFLRIGPEHMCSSTSNHCRVYVGPCFCRDAGRQCCMVFFQVLQPSASADGSARHDQLGTTRSKESRGQRPEPHSLTICTATAGSSVAPIRRRQARQGPRHPLLPETRRPLQPAWRPSEGQLSSLGDQSLSQEGSPVAAGQQGRRSRPAGRSWHPRTVLAGWSAYRGFPSPGPVTSQEGVGRLGTTAEGRG